MRCNQGQQHFHWKTFMDTSVNFYMLDSPQKWMEFLVQLNINTQTDIKYVITPRRKKLALSTICEQCNRVCQYWLNHSLPPNSQIPGNTHLKFSDSIFFFFNFFQTWIFQSFKERFLESLIMNSSRKKEIRLF